MIDYEKLKKAVLLCGATNEYWFEVDFCVNTFDDTKINIRLVCANTDEPTEFNSFDDLITKLQELTEPKYKYEPGQTVWYIDCTEITGPIFQGIVDYCETREVFFNESGYRNFVGLVNGLMIREDCVYPTKQALIEAQIEYWRDQLCDELDQYISPSCYPPHKEKECPNCHQLIFTELCPCRHKPVKEECQHLNQGVTFATGVNMCVDCKEVIPYKWSIKCHHESDGNTYPLYEMGKHKKCKKCGEFYK